tara:strand:- start:5 stop:388 length:384 start_codon:yes stop_codon:yes gene_type:complete
MKKYQQGDVVMFQVDEKTFDESIKYCPTKAIYSGGKKEKAILAFGEVTGHTHRVNMEEMLENAGVTLHMQSRDEAGKDVPHAFQVKNEIVTLKHEEHNPVDIPPGFYLVRIIREFNHITRRAQNVAD